MSIVIILDMIIYLVRHVETQGNIERRFNGVTESEYTEYGRYMKEELIKEFINLHEENPFDKIFTSPTRRAADTAETLAQQIEVDLEYSDALLEYNFGIFDGLLPEEAEKKDSEAYFKWINNHLYERIPGGDSYEEKFNQATQYLEGILKKDYKSIIIVTHGATLRCLLTYLLDLPLEAGWHFDIPLGGFCLIDYSHNYGTLKAMSTPFKNIENKNTKFVKNFVK